MALNGAMFQELVNSLASQAMGEMEEARVQPVLDQDSGHPDGLLLESALERVVVFGRDAPVLTLEQIAYIRKVMARVQARRAVLYVPIDTSIQNPVMLLATLSKVRIVRVAQA